MAKLWTAFILLTLSCVDESGKPIPVEFHQIDETDNCLVVEHYRRDGIFFSTCHQKNKSSYDIENTERSPEY